MKIFQHEHDAESQWLPISDLMSVLMMVFLLISISYMIKVSADKARIEEVAVTYDKLQVKLYEDLLSEFENDLERWGGAEIDKNTLSVRFQSPEILFAQGSSEIPRKFKNILSDFFPRFIKILYQKEYREAIEEIRIEGHTSTKWTSKTEDDQAYILNMALSQNRTRNVLEYVLNTTSLENSLKDWSRSNLTANGLSSSKIILKKDGSEDEFLSRRVEFRVRTNAESKITEILSEL